MKKAKTKTKAWREDFKLPPKKQAVTKRDRQKIRKGTDA